MSSHRLRALKKLPCNVCQWPMEIEVQQLVMQHPQVTGVLRIRPRNRRNNLVKFLDDCRFQDPFEKRSTISLVEPQTLATMTSF